MNSVTFVASRNWIIIALCTMLHKIDCSRLWASSDVLNFWCWWLTPSSVGEMQGMFWMLKGKIIWMGNSMKMAWIEHRTVGNWKLDNEWWKIDKKNQLWSLNSIWNQLEKTSVISLHFTFQVYSSRNFQAFHSLTKNFHFIHMSKLPKCCDLPTSEKDFYQPRLWNFREILINTIVSNRPVDHISNFFEFNACEVHGLISCPFQTLWLSRFSSRRTKRSSEKELDRSCHLPFNSSPDRTRYGTTSLKFNFWKVLKWSSFESANRKSLIIFNPRNP